MEIIRSDIVIIGAGGAGLRAAIEAAKTDPKQSISLISKVYPMRSHTVAAEGGVAAVIQDIDSLDLHFDDTVTGGDWLCEQDVVEKFVAECPKELTQMEHWGCPWSRNDDGTPKVRFFGGMKTARTWYAADKSGFHLLHTLYQTSTQYDSIKRFDEFFTTDLVLDDQGKCKGVIAIEMRSGKTFFFIGKSIILATGGAGRIFPFTTNGTIKTGDGMALAYRAGAALRDMEFVQYHPTGLPGTGILITEGARGEGGYLINKDGYRYLQDYNLGPVTKEPVKKCMELGPRDRLSQAFWHESQKGRTQMTDRGDVVYLDIRHLGRKKICKRLPLIRELSMTYMGIDPIEAPIPVRPVTHYTMGGIETDATTKTTIDGLYACGECASNGIHGANRLGSNSLAELLVFGARAGKFASENASQMTEDKNSDALITKAVYLKENIDKLRAKEDGAERVTPLKKQMHETMDKGVGIYREEHGLKETCKKIKALRNRYKDIAPGDHSQVFNNNFFHMLELGNMLDLAQVMAIGALNRKESRGSHQRLDYENRDDENFLKHTLAFYNGDDEPRLEYQEVKITKSTPAKRVYGQEADK